MLKRYSRTINRRILREAKFNKVQVDRAKSKAHEVLYKELDKLDIKDIKDRALDAFWHRSNPDYWAVLWSTAASLRDAADKIEKEGKRFIDKYYSSDIAPED